MLTLDEAIRQLRRDPAHADLVRDAYLGRDVRDSLERFRHSGEFHETLRLLGGVQGATIVDLGSGTGIAAAAFAAAGAALVYAIEPDPSEEVGRGAIARLQPPHAVHVLDALGEDMPLEEDSVDVVYARQVLHHALDLSRLVSECARVLRPGGRLLACREHVVDDAKELSAFLATHPVHRLAGGEHAYPLDAYTGALLGAGLTVERVFGPWESVVNAYPAIASAGDLKRLPASLLERRLGRGGRILGQLRPVQQLVWAYLRRPVPGRLYSFLATKPDAGAT